MAPNSTAHSNWESSKTPLNTKGDDATKEKYTAHPKLMISE